MPEGAVAVIRPLASGACPFHDQASGSLCSIQCRLGHQSLPAACRYFPRVTLLEPDAVRVTLSHFCPTAAWLLFRPGPGTLAIVDNAAGIADRDEHEGFDARHTIPPLARPGVATDPDTCRTWERYLVGTLDCEGRTPEDALACMAITADRIRAWDAREATLADHAERAMLAGAGPLPAGPWTIGEAAVTRLFAKAADSVPDGLRRPSVPAGFVAADHELVQPRWRAFARPLRRYLAAHAFGAWSAYLGDGLRSQVAALAVALAAVRVEAARHAAGAARRLDEPLLHAAIRSADLLLRHLSDPGILMRSLAGVEKASAEAFRSAIGLEAER
jgi:hypothetical protein